MEFPHQKLLNLIIIPIFIIIILIFFALIIKNNFLKLILNLDHTFFKDVLIFL